LGRRSWGAGWLDSLSEHRAENPTICNLEEARAACLLTCNQNACFEAAQPATVRYVWDSIRSLSPKTTNGSICLSSQLSSDQVVAACRERAASGGDTGRENTYLGIYDEFQVRARIRVALWSIPLAPEVRV